MTKRLAAWPDLLLTLPTILLLSLGILIIFSSDSKLAIQQLLFALIGLVIYWLLSSIDFDFYKFYVNFLYIGIFALLVIVFLIGLETRGSLRWISLLGMQFQPSELAKPIMILFLAKYWSANLPSWKNILKSLLLISPVIGLIFKQPDLGTALTIMAIWLVMLMGANIDTVKLVVMGLVSTILAPVLWLFMRDYQKDRILSFIAPDTDPLGIGYNVIQSTIAVGSGQLLGRGLGRGTQSRLQFLPEFRTDFIFASIAEELGLIGATVVLSLYSLLIGRSLKIIAETGNTFGSLLVFGTLGMLFFQVVVNVGMNIGLVPVTGITLPLLSYGGSSLISTLMCLSFIASVAKFGQRKMLVSNSLD